MNTKEQIKTNIKWDTERTKDIGGQHAEFCRAYPSVLISEELDIKITVGHYRSQTKNKELAYTLFEKALDEIYEK